MERENDTLMCAEPAAAYAVCPHAYAAPPVMRVVTAEDYDLDEEEDEEEYEPWDPTPEELEWLDKEIAQAEKDFAAGRYYEYHFGETWDEFEERIKREGFAGVPR